MPLSSHKPKQFDSQQKTIGDHGSYSYALNQMLLLEQQLLDLYEDAPFGAHTIDSEGSFLSMNAQALTWLGYQRNEVVREKHFQDLLTPNSQSKYLKYINTCSEQYSEQTIKLDLCKKNGDTLPCTLHAKHMLNHEGHLTSWQAVVFRVQGNNINNHISSTTISASELDGNESTIIIDVNHYILQMNQAYTNMSGYSPSDMLGKEIDFHHDELQNKAFYEAMWAHVSHHNEWEGELWRCRKNGEVFLARCHITALTNHAQETTHYVVSFADTSIDNAVSNKIRHLAFYDSLTDLPNRQLMTDRLNQALAQSNRTGHYGALLFIDLDDFKVINDTLGHELGDALLLQVAHRLKAALRTNDTVARFGGDEFVFILEYLGKDATISANRVKIISANILASLKQAYVIEKNTVSITASIGVDLFNKSTPSAQILLRNADIAMYQAKKSGHDSLCFFNEKMQRAINIHATKLADLKRAITEKQFVLHYQIQTNTQADIIGCEALIRWQHPQLGLVTPDKFIPTAEESGLIKPLGFWVLETACAQLKKWATEPATAHIPIAINLSAAQLQQKEFVSQIKTAIKKYGIKPNLLKLEITESMLIDNLDNTILSMMTLKKLGVSFELDDFGTGYSSLQYLKRLPIKQLKIERSFIHSMCQHKSNLAIVKTIIAIAQNFNLDVIAEGVETETQKNLLIAMGCKHFQGYLFAKPLPIEQLNHMLQTKT